MLKKYNTRENNNQNDLKYIYILSFQQSNNSYSKILLFQNQIILFEINKII
jgi:hypothetical protein